MMRLQLCNPFASVERVYLLFVGWRGRGNATEFNRWWKVDDDAYFAAINRILIFEVVAVTLEHACARSHAPCSQHYLKTMRPTYEQLIELQTSDKLT